MVCILPVQGANSPNTLSAWNERPHKVKPQHDSRKYDSALGILTKSQQFGWKVTSVLDERGSSCSNWTNLVMIKRYRPLVGPWMPWESGAKVSTLEMKKGCWDDRSEIRSLKLCDVTHLALLPEELAQQERFEAFAIQRFEISCKSNH